MWLAAALLALVITGCASEVARHPSVLTVPPARVAFTAAASTTFRIDSGYSRTIPRGMEFVDAGTIREGRVLKPTGVFTIEGAHMHEAYPVERDGRLVGFYLPVEKAFSPLSNPVTFILQGKPPK